MNEPLLCRHEASYISSAPGSRAPVGWTFFLARRGEVLQIEVESKGGKWLVDPDFGTPSVKMWTVGAEFD